MNDEATHERLQFGTFELDTVTQELWRAGHRVPLRPQPARLLTLLARHAGQLVSRETIRNEMWGNETVVEFDQGVNTCIRQIRAALGDDARRPRFVETVPKRGYRFLADVCSTSGNVAAPPVEAAAPRVDSRRGQRVAMVALVLALVIVSAVLVRVWREGRAPVGDGVLRLAVLPFENLSGDADQDYLSDGVTEELIFHLSRMRPDRLAVIARTSVIGYKGAARSVRDIGKELGVHYVLEGSVRQDADRVRVTAQLIEVHGETHVWSDSYARAMHDVFALQGDVAQRVAEALAVELLVPEVAVARGAYTDNGQAYDLYLRGRYQWNRFDGDGMRRAEKLLREAVTLDSEFALAWSALGDVYNLMPYYTDMRLEEAYAEAKACARRALAIDDQVAAAHNTLGFALFYFDRNWARADSAFRRSVELEPGYAMAHHWYAGLLSAQGRHDDAIRHVRVAVELDPLSLSVRADLEWYYMFARRYEDAVAEARRALRQEPYHGFARQGLIVALAKLGRYDEAWAELRTYLEGHGKPTQLFDSLAVQPREDALRSFWRIDLERRMADGYAAEDDPYAFAVNHAMVGNVEHALRGLELAVERHDPWVVFVAVDPRLDAVRVHPRFEALVRSLRLGSSS